LLFEVFTRGLSESNEGGRDGRGSDIAKAISGVIKANSTVLDRFTDDSCLHRPKKNHESTFIRFGNTYLMFRGWFLLVALFHIFHAEVFYRIFLIGFFISGLLETNEGRRGSDVANCH